MEIDKEKRAFGENLRRLRRGHHLTQSQMAAIMGIGVKSLRRIERGDFPKRFYADHLFRLVEYFHIPADSLFLTDEKADE